MFGRSMTQLTMDVSRALAKEWGPGDEVVVTRLDHDANVRPWVIAAEARGATVRWADFDPETAELDPSAVAEHVNDRTKVVAVTAASNLLGTRPYLPAIADVAHAHGRTAVRRRRAPHRARRHRRPGAGSRLLRVLAVQVPRPTLRRARRRPRAAGDDPPRQARALDGDGAGAVRARDAAVRADGRHHRGRRPARVAGGGRGPKSQAAHGIRGHRGARGPPARAPRRGPGHAAAHRALTRQAAYADGAGHLR